MRRSRTKSPASADDDEGVDAEGDDADDEVDADESASVGEDVPTSGTSLTTTITRYSWLARWLVEAPSRWFGRRSGVGQDLAGGTDGLSYLRHLARGNRIRRQATFDQVPSAAPPVLLIHGFLGTRGSMYMLERRLVDDRFVVVSFNIGPLNTRDIRRSAFLIHRKIERILAQTPSQKIDIVGHSMGGLIGLYYIKKLGGHARVRRLVMMGTPVRGTWSALAGVVTLGLWSTSSWQLLPRSRFLDELAQGPLPPGVEVYTIAAARDWVVPLATTRMPGASAVTVPLGHSSLVVSEDVYRRLMAILRPHREVPPEPR
jgi:pimeloyl-ACP methyl ester carboxylesterase